VWLLGPTTLPRAIRGVPYEAQLSVEGGTLPYTWGLLDTALPQGLSLKPDGHIVGTPRAVADETFELTFQVHDQYGAPATATVGLEYYGPVLTLAKKRLVVPAGAKFRTELEVAGGAGPYLFEVVGGKLPPRVALGKRGAVVARRAHTATRRVVVRVTDRRGGFALFKLRIDVKPVTAVAIP